MPGDRQLDESLVSASEREALRAVLDVRANTFVARVERLRALRRVFHEELAAVIQSEFYEHMRHSPDSTYKDRHELVVKVNRTADRLGLTLRAPDSGRPATLVTAQRIPDGPDAHQFWLKVRDDKGRFRIMRGSRHVMDLELMPAPTRTEEFAPWLGEIDGHDSPAEPSR